MKLDNGPQVTLEMKGRNKYNNHSVSNAKMAFMWHLQRSLNIMNVVYNQMKLYKCSRSLCEI